MGGVVVNLVRGPQLSTTGDARRAMAGSLDPERHRAGLSEAGSTSTDELVDGLLAEAASTPSGASWRTSSARLADSDVPTYELPRLADGIDLGALYELADDLRDAG